MKLQATSDREGRAGVLYPSRSVTWVCPGNSVTWVRRVSLEGRGSWRLSADHIPWGSAGDLCAIRATVESRWAVRVPLAEGTCVLGREGRRSRAVIPYFTFSMSRPSPCTGLKGSWTRAWSSGERSGLGRQPGPLSREVSAEGHLGCECGQAIWSVTKRKSQKRAQRKRGEVGEG